MQYCLYVISRYFPLVIRRGAMIFAAVFLVSACGGGSDSGGTNSTVLVVNAGADTTVTEGVTVDLSATASGGDSSYTFNWSSSPALAITHADTTLSAASFVAPSVDATTRYTLTVSVNDQSGNTASDAVVITVAPVNIAPQAIIDIPQWDNLQQGVFPSGVEVILDGTASSDEDSTGGAIDTYTWSQTSGVNVIAGADTNLSTLTITTPIAVDSQQLTFQLEVTDGEGASDTATVTLTVQSESETLPISDAGFSQSVFSGEIIILEGSASSSVAAFSDLTFLWEQSTNLSLDTGQTIDDDTKLSTFAVAPLVEEATLVAYTLTVTDLNGNSVEDTINVRIRPMPTPLLNDTGVLQQATNSALTLAQQNDFPGQDGQKGADVIDKNGFIEKAGRGKAGFDFTRLNANGDEQDADVAQWSCVRDNVTGLVWEVKTNDGTLQDNSFTYTWYSEENNGGFAGDQAGTNASCLLNTCNTSAYVEAINTQGLCGFYDWRLPTHQELFSLMHLGLRDSTAIDDDYFPNTGVFSSQPLWYWTSVPSADGVSSDDARNAWALDFNSGVDNFLNKSSAGKVRLVRAGR